MATVNELQEYVNQCMTLVVKNGATIEYANALYKAAMVYKTAKDNKGFMETLKKARGVCESTIEKNGYTILQAEMAAQKAGVETTEINLWYQILKELAIDDFDSYMLYLERKRTVEERFYMPRRKCLLKTNVVQSLQDLEDDKYDVMSLSLPPGIGKAQPLYSKVLTPNGFVDMGSLKVGDKVIAASGKESNVLGIYPQGKQPVYEITLTDGRTCRCSDEHLWQCWNGIEWITTTLSRIIAAGYSDFEIPFLNDDKIEKYPILNVRYIGEEECQCIYIDDESHLYITDDYIITHNTTVEKFFTSWIIGRHPLDYNLFFSHSDDITRMFYDGILDITTSSEYCWQEIFPNVPFRKKDANRQQIDFTKNKPFWSIQCTSRFSSNAGKVRTNRYLLCDDIIASISEAMNLNFLDKLWGIYSVDARQRKLNSQVKELHICTRWSVHDIVGRLKRVYEGNPRAKFLAVPDIDPKTGESNFMFEINGMSTEFFNDQRKLMDEASYRALYKNEPIEREGLLFPEASLRRYLELPVEKPDEILGQCDCKAKGTDFMVMPILYRYGNDYYAVDAVCNQDPDYEVQYQSLANMIVDHETQNVEFESNQGGDRVAMEVNKRVSEMGWVCNITDKPTETNKEARIYQYSNWVKSHIIFRDKSMYDAQSDYGNFMGNLMGYTVAGKNAHDDVPDCLSNFAARQIKKTTKGATVSAITNPFRSGFSVNDVWGY